MKKHILITLIAMLSAIPLMAQYSPCYEAAFSEGKRLYNAGKYSQAKKQFQEAKNCPDPNTAAADEWIGKCDKGIKESKKISQSSSSASSGTSNTKPSSSSTNKNDDAEAAKTAYMTIRKVDFGNCMNSGTMIDDFGADLYYSDVRYVKPRITYDGLADHDVTIDLKLIETSNSNVDDFSDSFHVSKGTNNTQILLGYGSDKEHPFSTGEYKFELWYEGNKIYTAYFEIKSDYSRNKYDKLPSSEMVRKNAENRNSLANDFYSKGEYEEAVKWYRKAADLGLAKSQNTLGVMYTDGKGVDKDYVEAVRWYRKAAEQGQDWGEYNLGVRYEYGEGVEVDYGEALRWYLKAADQYLPDAQNRIGMMYYNGHGVEKDYGEAVKWFKLAANNDFKTAQYNAGFMYEYGYGVTKNIETAKSWYRKAAANGHEDARKRLEELESQGITITANGVSFLMKPINGGTFRMGSNDSEARADEQTIHSVTLNSFYMGETEVTQALWKAVMGENPSDFVGDDLPVESVSWNDCQTFIRKLNQLTGKNFRLPTEAEWEYAARGGKTTSLYNGENIRLLGLNNSPNLDLLGWYGGNCGRDFTYGNGCDYGRGINISEWDEKQYSDETGGTHPVKRKQPNAYGLYDMLGNVWEWCGDWYDSEYYSVSSSSNPTGPYSGTERVLRGGSWVSYARACRVSKRSFSEPDDKYNGNGLRLVLPK